MNRNHRILALKIGFLTVTAIVTFLVTVKVLTILDNPKHILVRSNGLKFIVESARWKLIGPDEFISKVGAPVTVKFEKPVAMTTEQLMAKHKEQKDWEVGFTTGKRVFLVRKTAIGAEFASDCRGWVFYGTVTGRPYVFRDPSPDNKPITLLIGSARPQHEPITKDKVIVNE